MTDTQPPTDQPDGIDPYEFELPDPVRAAKRVDRFLQAYGDGIVEVRVSPEYQETMPPLYARDLEVLRKVATADAVRLTPADQPGDANAPALADLSMSKADRLAHHIGTALFGTEDGGFVPDYSELPVGNLWQLLREVAIPRLLREGWTDDQAAELATLRAENERLEELCDASVKVLSVHVDQVRAGKVQCGHPDHAQARDQADSGAARITAERQRQITAEGWTPEHDQQHTHGELVAAAIFYADDTKPHTWPWGNPPKRRGRVRDLERAGALIAAEIDRLAQARDQAGTAALPADVRQAYEQARGAVLGGAVMDGLTPTGVTVDEALEYAADLVKKLGAWLRRDQAAAGGTVRPGDEAIELRAEVERLTAERNTARDMRDRNNAALETCEAVLSQTQDELANYKRKCRDLHDDPPAAAGLLTTHPDRLTASLRAVLAEHPPAPGPDDDGRQVCWTCRSRGSDWPDDWPCETARIAQDALAARPDNSPWGHWCCRAGLYASPQPCPTHGTDTDSPAAKLANVIGQVRDAVLQGGQSEAIRAQEVRRILDDAGFLPARQEPSQDTDWEGA